MKDIKIISIVGARPNFMKVASLVRAIESHNASGTTAAIEHLIVHTGQHYDERMSDFFFKELELPAPQFNLEVGSASHAVQTAQIMERFEPVLLKEKPDVLLVVGDVNSTIACTLVASKIEYTGVGPRIRPLIGHVEAGLRSFDRDMPEEINRILTDALSDLLFTTEEDAQVNLEREGISREKIYFVGNVMIDTLIRHMGKAASLTNLNSLGIKGENSGGAYGVVTLHRPSNVDKKEILARLINCIEKISIRLPIIFSLHPRTEINLKKFGLYEGLAENKGIYLTKPLGYLEFLNRVLSASLVLTDSGGIQEETTFFKIPCITLRNNTERPITVSLGTNYLVGNNPEKIIETAFIILDKKGKSGRIPPLWDGKAGNRIIDILIKRTEKE
jgi:UDP-N-acetylglucosamine 2-epimerase (non-hydrolysing)